VESSSALADLVARIKRLLHYNLNYSQACRLLSSDAIPVQTALLQVRPIDDVDTLVLSYRRATVAGQPKELLHHALSVRFELTSPPIQQQIDGLAHWLLASIQARSSALPFNGWVHLEGEQVSYTELGLRRLTFVSSIDGRMTLLPITSLGTAV
jgi:hypothetical protein